MNLMGYEWDVPTRKIISCATSTPRMAVVQVVRVRRPSCHEAEVLLGPCGPWTRGSLRQKICGLGLLCGTNDD